jgi:hypothetical protein
MYVLYIKKLVESIHFLKYTIWSGYRESNSEINLGKVSGYLYIIPALLLIYPWCERRDSNPHAEAGDFKSPVYTIPPHSHRGSVSITKTNLTAFIFDSFDDIFKKNWPVICLFNTNTMISWINTCIIYTPCWQMHYTICM